MYSTSKGNEYMGVFIDYLSNTIPTFDGKRKKKSTNASESSSSKKQKRKRPSNDGKKKSLALNCEIVFQDDPTVEIKDEPLRLKEESEEQIRISQESGNMDLTIVIADDDEKDEEISIIEPDVANQTNEMFHDLYNISECGASCSRHSESNDPFIGKCPVHTVDRGMYNKIFCAPTTTDEAFFKYCRILPYQFRNLYNIVSSELWDMAPPKNSKKNFIHPQMELAVTLTFLTQGFTYAKLAREFCVTCGSVAEIVPKVCGAICSCLESTYLPQKSVADWLLIADKFWKKKLFPHTAGTFDGQILRQQGTSDAVLMLICCDVDFNILRASLCKYDTDNIRKCTFFQLLMDQMESLPVVSANTNLTMPHFFVGAPKMPLMASLMTPHRKYELTPMQRNLNRRLAEITNIVDETFVMLANRFWLYKRHFSCTVESMMIAMRATVSLHNFLRRTGGDIRCPLNVETKLEPIDSWFGSTVLCEQAVSNRKKLARFLNPQKEIVTPEEESDVIVIE